MNTQLPCPERSNCLIWSKTMRHLYGGEVKRVRSHNGPWPHWIWISPEGERWSYEPQAPHTIPYDYVWFRGKLTQNY